MLHIILTCLKIIGIILASILGLILLLVLLVLFVPIKYYAKAEKHEVIKGICKVSWLFNIVSLKGCYNNDNMNVKLKIFGITFYNNLKEKRYKKKNKYKKDRCNKNQKEEIVKEEVIEEEAIKQDLIKINNKENAKFNWPVSKIENEERINNSEFGDNIQSSDFVEKKSRFKILYKKIKGFFYKVICIIKSIIEKIKYLLEKIKSSMKNTFKNVKIVKTKLIVIREFFEEDINRFALKTIWDSLKKILKHIKPRKFEAFIRFGTGDMYSTGQTLIALSVTYPIYGKNIRVIPDFENKVIEGNVYIKGRIRLASLIIIGIKLYLDKNFKLFLKNLEQLKEEF